MMLGDAIPTPRSHMLGDIAQEAVEKYLSERGGAAEVLRLILEQQQTILVQLTAIADQQRAAAQALGDAATQLASASRQVPPMVHVAGPDMPMVHVDAPVTVDVPQAQVVVGPAQLPSRVVKHIERDRDTKLVTRVIEEWS